MDAVAPGLLLAQGIGRIGQLVQPGAVRQADRPAVGAGDRPGASASLPAKYLNAHAFHPTFLYELTYDLIGVLRSCSGSTAAFKIRRPGLFALYVSYYCFGRFFEELLRIDPAHEYLGLRLNAWVSIVVFVLSTAFFIWWQFIREPPARDRPRASTDVAQPGPAMAVPKGRVRSGR